MSESLRDSAVNYLNEALKLMQEGKCKEALIELEQVEETSLKAKAFDVCLYAQAIKGQLMQTLDAYEEALKIHSLTLKVTEEILSKDPGNEFYQSIFWNCLKDIGNLGNIFYSIGRFPQAKSCYELQLSIFKKLSQIDPKNLDYQSDVAVALNNLGTLLLDMGSVEEAKERLEKALNIRRKLLLTDPENVDYKSDVGGTLNNLGNLLFSMNCLEEAKRKYEEALEMKEKVLQTNLENTMYQSDVAMALNNLGNLLFSLNSIEEAKQRYENALEIHEKLVKSDPKNIEYQSHVGSALNSLGLLLSNMGCLEEAKQKYEEALDIREKILLIDPENVTYQSHVGKTLNGLGLLLSDMGRIEEAKQRYKKALEIHEKLLQANPENVAYKLNAAMTLKDLGLLLSYTGCIEEAKQRYEESLKIYKNLLETDPENVVYQSDVGGTLNNLGTLLKNIGHFQEAKGKYEKALEIYDELLQKDPQNLAYQSLAGETLNTLGLLLSDMGLFEEVKERFERALEIYERLLKTDPENAVYQSDVGGTLNNLGTLFKNTGHIEEAKQIFEKALEMRETLLQNDLGNMTYQSYVGKTFNDLGDLLSDMGRFEEAKQKYEKALEIREKLRKTDPENLVYLLDIGTTINGLSILLSFMGRIEESKQRYEQALETFEKLLHTDQENVKYQLVVAMTLNNLGNLLSYMGLNGEAKQRYEKSLEMKEKLLHLDPENVAYQLDVGRTLDNLGRLLNTQENCSVALDFHLKALNYFSRNSANLNLLFRAYVSIGSCYEKLDDYDSAFINYKEAIKCVESIRSQHSIEETKMDIMWDKCLPYADMISFLCTKMNDTEKAWECLGLFKSRTLLDSLRLLELESPKNVPEEFVIQEENLLASIRTLDRLIRKTEKSDKVTQLTREIKEKETELNEVYNRIREFSPEYVDLRKGQPLGIKEIKDLIGSQIKKTAFVEYFTTDDRVFIFVMRSDKKISKVKIVDLTEKSLLNHVQKYFKEIIEMKCKIGETWQNLSKYLINPIFRYIKNCELVYLVPHGLLHYLPLHALVAENKRLIEHFPIVYSPSLTVLKYSQSKQSRKLESCLSIGYTPNEEEKEIFEGEAELVAELFNVKPKLGSKATSEILRNSNNDLIHISCHGGFDRDNSLNSGLTLANGHFSVKEIFDLDLDTGLLVLSACETGLNKQKPGDELIGLTRAFLYAGAESLIVSLWSVWAESTLTFMERFYKKIKDNNMNKAEALKQTQIEFIHDEKYSNPYLWAPFILIGDWE